MTTHLNFKGRMKKYSVIKLVNKYHSDKYTKTQKKLIKEIIEERTENRTGAQKVLKKLI